MRQAEEVDRLFARAKTIDPREPLTELEWAMALQMLDRHDDAIAHLQEAILIYPDWPLALKGVAFSYLDTGRAEEALPILERLHGLYPDDPTSSSCWIRLDRLCSSRLQRLAGSQPTEQQQEQRVHSRHRDGYE